MSLSAQALAAPTDADRATARALAAEGHQALQRQDFAAAEDRFRRADALIHAPTLVVDHARALVGLGRLAEAYERYDSVIREGVAPDAPIAFKRALQNATQEVEALKPKLAWLTLVVKGPAEPEVTIDGYAVPSAAVGTRRAIDPGSRSIRVTAPGFQPKEAQIELVPGQNAELDLELEEEVAAPEPEALPEAVPSLAPRPPSSETRDRDHTLAYVALGVGGAGLATGIVTGVIALGTRSSILSACPELKCTPETDDQYRTYQSDAKRYRTFGTISGVGFGLGLAGAAAGIALLLMDQDAHAEKSAASLVPVVGPRAIGVRGSF